MQAAVLSDLNEPEGPLLSDLYPQVPGCPSFDRRSGHNGTRG